MAQMSPNVCITHGIILYVGVCAFFNSSRKLGVGKEPVVVIVGTVSLAQTRLCSEMETHCLEAQWVPAWVL